MRRSLSGQGVRFLVAGAANALASYLLYLFFLLALPYPGAYSLSYAAGILISFLLNSLFVFQVPLRWSKLLRFPLVYLVQYLLGIGVLALLVERLGLDPRLGPLAVLLVTLPVSFGLTRWVLKGRRKGAAFGEDEKRTSG